MSVCWGARWLIFKESKAYFGVILATLCDLGHFEYGRGDLKLWSTFPLFHASYFTEVFLCLGLHVVYVNFEKSTTCASMRGQQRNAPN